MTTVREMIEDSTRPFPFPFTVDEFAHWCGVERVDELDGLNWEQLENLPKIKARTLYIAGPGKHMGMQKITWMVKENQPDEALWKTIDGAEGGDRLIGTGNTVSEAAIMGLVTACELTTYRLRI